MIRECVRISSLYNKILESEHVWMFFDLAHMPNFDVASDAFATIRELLTRDKEIAAGFLESKYERVFEKYQKMLWSENYITRRLSLKLIGELLLDRSNFGIMMRYISGRENLKTMMNLLRDGSGNIQFEGEWVGVGGGVRGAIILTMYDTI